MMDLLRQIRLGWSELPGLALPATERQNQARRACHPKPG